MISWPLTIAHGQGRLALGHCNRGRIDIQLMQGSIRVVPRAVRVVGPGRVGNPPVERKPRVIAIVDTISGVVRVRRSRTDLNVRGERLPPVFAEGSPELSVV